MITLYEKLKIAGCEIDNHESDLYVKATAESRHIIKDSGMTFTTFHHQVTRDLWFEVPFAFDPFWKSKP